jgi:hypothetical protein
MRAQGFPDWFTFDPDTCPVTDMYKQIGNAVAPPVARALGRELLKVVMAKWEQNSSAHKSIGNEQFPDFGVELEAFRTEQMEPPGGDNRAVSDNEQYKTKHTTKVVADPDSDEDSITVAAPRKKNQLF